MANEAETVQEFLTRVVAQLNEQDAVFCILDNACTDSTRQIIDEMAADEPRIVHVWAPENRSVVDAYFRGYREALDAGCDWILEMDAGLSHNPDEISRFRQAMSDGYEFAAGSRFMEGGKYSGRWSRYLLSKGGTLLARLLLGSKMKDMTSGFQCFNRASMQYVLDHPVQSRAHFFQTEIRHMLHEWNWVEVPISYQNPSKRVGSGSIKDALRHLYRLWRAGRHPAPKQEKVAS